MRIRKLMVYLSLSGMCFLLFGCNQKELPIDSSLADNPYIPLLTQPQLSNDEYANQNRRQRPSIVVIGDNTLYLSKREKESIRRVFAYGQTQPFMDGTAYNFQVDELYLYYINNDELTDGSIHNNTLKKAPHPAIEWLMRLNLKTGEREKLVRDCGTYQCHDGYIYYTPGYDGLGYIKNDEPIPDNILQERDNLYRVDMDGSHRKLIHAGDFNEYLFCDKGILIRTREGEGNSTRCTYAFYSISGDRVELLWQEACGEKDRAVECGGQLYSLVKKPNAEDRIVIYPVDESGVSTVPIGEYTSETSYFTLLFDNRTMNLIRPYLGNHILYEGESFSLCEVGAPNPLVAEILVYKNKIVLVCGNSPIKADGSNLGIIPRT